MDISEVLYFVIQSEPKLSVQETLSLLQRMQTPKIASNLERKFSCEEASKIQKIRIHEISEKFTKYRDIQFVVM